MKILKPTLLATAASLAMLAPQIALTADAQSQQDIQALQQEIQMLKMRYAEEVRKLRELDARMRALSAPPATAQPQAAPSMPSGEAAAEGQTMAAAEEPTQREARPARSVEDLLSQEHAVFDRRLTLEAGVDYSRYDRRQLTLNGFLALNSIFLGNIAVEDIKSDILTYTLAGRYALTPRTIVSVQAPFIQRSITYLKAGAEGEGNRSDEFSDSSSPRLGDVTAGISYRLFPETATNPDVVISATVTAPTGLEPYGIKLIEVGDPTVGLRVPERQPTGNGIAAASLGASFVKTLDPAILFASIGYTHTFQRDFDDLSSDPGEVSPGTVDLGDSFNFGLGMAFALNERTSLSLSFADKITGTTRLSTGGQWQDIVGSKANAATFNMGVTYALTNDLTLVTGLGVGLTPDAPDFNIGIKLPYVF
ncbi:MAG: hypothetical protein AB1344_07435 [Pseudomonadota bacterium]